MRPLTSTALAVPFLLSSFVSAVTFECGHIRKDGKKFNLSKLGGPHSIIDHDESRPPAVYNTTFTIDICDKLQRDSKIDKVNQCPEGTRVCGIKTFTNPTDEFPKIEIENVIPIAGNYEHEARYLDPKWERLKAMDSNKDGLQVEFNGGSFAKRKQKAIIEFQCDMKRTGNEEYTASEKTKRDDDKEKGDKKPDDEKDDRSLTFVSYGSADGKEELDVLRLKWRTKYACEDYDQDADDDDDGSRDKTAGWGFFTWFILILFLSIAAYLIFGSWLNYNRYGARGWDLLPHGDTIRDMPYLFKDWSRKVVGTVAGTGSRGGYSAV